MASLSTESANLTWQRVKMLLGGQGGAAQLNKSGVTLVFRALRTYLAQHKGNPDLQLIQFTDADITTNLNPIDGAVTLYAAYVQKTGTSGTGTATDSFFKVYDDATNDGTAGDGRLALPLLAANDIGIYINPTGLAIADGLVLVAHTTCAGATDSTAGDAGPGFIIIGA
jgi:hypothetical protein